MTEQQSETQQSATQLATHAAGGTLAALFARSVRVFADRTAVTWPDGSYTYAELGERSTRLATVLTGAGIRRGDRVAVLSETRQEYVETYLALASLGVTALTLNIRMHADEIAYCIESGKPVGMIVSGGLRHLVDPIADDATTIRSWWCLDGAEGRYADYATAIAEAAAPDEDSPAVDIAPDDIHNVLYTSGTTGRPKGAMISQQAAAVRALRLAQWFSLTPDDGFIGWLPLFHCGGDESLYATLLTGGRFAAISKAEPETMYRLIERDRLSWTLLLPGVLTDFLYHPARTEHDLSSMRFAIGYANMMPKVVAELTEKCQIDFYDAFGQTESSYLLAHGLSRPGEMPSLRKTPSPLLDVRIVDDQLRELPPGKPGECVVRGPSVMSGYLDDADATAEAFAGGWLHTGDVLIRNDDGTLTYVDRTKFLIKTGGENVYPAEVEQVISQLDAVQEVAVFGVPDERWGETVKAVIVVRPDAELGIEDVDQVCREQLAGYKRPHYIEFATEERLPRSATGKLQRHVLATWPITETQRT